MKKKINNRLTIWWKLAIASVIINILTIPLWVLLRWGEILLMYQNKLMPTYAHYSLIIFCSILAIPLVYFSVFCIWHWRTRYAGKYPLSWPILVVLTYWPNIITTLPGSFFIAIVYFFMHIIPDLKEKGVYANPPSIRIDSSAPKLPKSFELAKSACFTIGWALLVLSLLAASLTLKANFTIWNVIANRIPQLVGEPFSEKFAEAFIGIIEITKICVITSFLCVIGIAIGAIFIYTSQKLRWRLLEDEEKEELKKSFNKENSRDGVPPQI